jgi:hypothetical protein
MENEISKTHELLSLAKIKFKEEVKTYQETKYQAFKCNALYYLRQIKILSKELKTLYEKQQLKIEI